MTETKDNTVVDPYPDTGFNLDSDFNNSIKDAKKTFDKASVERFSGIKYLPKNELVYKGKEYLPTNEFTFKGNDYSTEVSLALNKLFVHVEKKVATTDSDVEDPINVLVAFDIAMDVFATIDFDTNYWKRTLSDKAIIISSTIPRYVFDREQTIRNLNKLLIEMDTNTSEVQGDPTQLIDTIINGMSTIDSIKSYIHLIIQTVTHTDKFTPTKYLYEELKNAGWEYNDIIQAATLGVIGLQKVLRENNLLDGLNAGTH